MRECTYWCDGRGDKIVARRTRPEVALGTEPSRVAYRLGNWRVDALATRAKCRDTHSIVTSRRLAATCRRIVHTVLAEKGL